MKTRLFATATLIALAFILQGCFNSEPATYYDTGTAASYPKWYGQPYAYAPYDPNGTYYYQPYQYPYPYYYEGYYDHDCGETPCNGRPTYFPPRLEAKAEPVTVPAQAKPAPAAQGLNAAPAAPSDRNNKSPTK